MLKNYTNIFFLSVIFLILQGCALAGSYTPEEFRSDVFYRKTVKIDSTVQKIIDAYILNHPVTIGKYSITDYTKIVGYNKITNIKVSPDKKSATIWWQTTVWGYGDTLALIDFQQDLHDKTTTAKVYWYEYKGTFDQPWKNCAEDVLAVLWTNVDKK